MMIMQLEGQEFLVRYPKDNDIFQELTNFYGHNGSLPIIAEKKHHFSVQKMHDI